MDLNERLVKTAVDNNIVDNSLDYEEKLLAVVQIIQSGNAPPEFFEALKNDSESEE